MKMKKNLFKQFTMLAILIVGLLAVSAVGVFAQDKRDDSDKPSAEMAKQAKITMEQAKAIALKRVPGTILEEDLEMERGRLQYAFDIKDANGKIFDVEIDAKTGAVLTAVQDNGKEDADDDDDDNESTAMKNARMAKLSKGAGITMEQARAIALSRVPGTITEEDLEMEKGVLQYSFDVKDANGKVFDIEIDAKTGKVLKAVEDKEDEDDDN